MTQLSEYRVDHRGNMIHEKNINPIDLLEDQLVEKLMKHAADLNAQIARFRGHCFDDITAFLDLLFERYQAKRGGKKGNMTFLSFDGLAKVTVQVAEKLQVTSALRAAEALIDECIKEWAEGSHDNIRAIVSHAFRQDKEGNVSVSALLELSRVKIEDERWQRGVAALKDSLRPVGSRTYLRFYRRANQDARWSAITIDLASAETPASTSEEEAA